MPTTSHPQNSLFIAGMEFDARVVAISLFVVIGVLEYSTPPDYIFGYLYTAPLAIVGSRFRRSTSLWIYALAIVLTLGDLWIPGWSFAASTVANRTIAIVALIVTFILTDRNRDYAEDVTKVKIQLHAQEALAKVREDFIATLTHDLKTPLLGAIEMMRFLANGKFGEVTSEQKQVFETLRKSHGNTLRIVQMLLDVFHNDARGLRLQVTRVNLVEIAREATEAIAAIASSREIEIRMEVMSSFAHFWLHADALQLERVFVNLLANALHHSIRGSEIRLILEAPPHTCIAKILDTGSGIAPEDLPHLFDRFYQGESDSHPDAYRRLNTGSGLGLYLSRQIIEAHGGKIWAENQVPKGAMFGFTLLN
ncbi:HAMP domain-containing sensor histidine kinase [Tumidithrix helvetica PCC 7403]|uniref:sensor histidine kinase n=1 Tax=Tumidithrix helvetica TaxID=3457545 RepID=UPI003CA769BB